MEKPANVLGLMSGTSMDGVDLALLETDGIEAGKRLASAFTAYPDEVRTAIRGVLGLSADIDGRVALAEKLVTDWHIKAVNDFKAKAPVKIDLLGFHGQTIFHDPAAHKTWQIGDGQRLANETGIQTVFDFRSNDMKHGGQGAPLLPLYHAALLRKAKLGSPACILNIGGVANITWVKGEDVRACDTGPGNALLDDWMLKKTGIAMDRNGDCARRGKSDDARVAKWMQNPYFSAPAPKSLDRNAFISCAVDDLSLEDGAATLTAFTVASVLLAVKQMPSMAQHVIVAGGGRHNNTMMRMLGGHMAVTDADQLGWSGDHLEAEGFAYLAARSLAGLPTSLPSTTGCSKPNVGGRFVRPKVTTPPVNHSFLG